VDSDNDDKDSDDSDTASSTSSEDSDVYVPGLLDDPDMVLGRHRNVMIGDRVTGPVVASTIQFVKPALLKAELNKQFRDRFDGWEPPKSQRKYIGARVSQGNYVLMDPTDDYDEQSYERRRTRQGSTSSLGSASAEQHKETMLRMPPSLTLSKIRSLKHQALQAAVKAKLEIGTLAIACVYFERLCLDCRVDKSNRRLCFAACLLLAVKMNEPNVGLVMRKETDSGSDDGRPARLTALVRPNKRSSTMYASLLEFFTQEWSLSLKHLFNAEFGVFAALGFDLHTTPSQVAFHFKRLMKTLEWNPHDYLGSTMYNQWQEALADEEERRIKRERRQETKRKRKQERLLNLHIEIENEVIRRKNERRESVSDEEPHVKEIQTEATESTGKEDLQASAPTKSKLKKGIKLFNPFGMKRSASQERFTDRMQSAMVHQPTRRRSSGAGGMTLSPSMPAIATAFSDTGIVAIDIPDTEELDTSSIASQNGSYSDGIVV
jgi:hypothetical protein